MFCPKCGAQNSDNAAFCEQCGAALSAQTSQPVQPVQPAPSAQPMPTATPINLEKPGQTAGQPVQPGFNAGQPVFGQQPQQFQQPIGGQQPAYAAPVYSQPSAPKKSKAVTIIIFACSAVVTAFLIVLFTVIIPNNSGIRGKLRHKWSMNDSGATLIYDFKKNTASAMGLSFPIEWEIVGDDRLTIGVSVFGETESEEYIFSLSADGKTLTLTDPDYPSSVETYTRAD